MEHLSSARSNFKARAVQILSAYHSRLYPYKLDSPLVLYIRDVCIFLNSYSVISLNTITVTGSTSFNLGIVSRRSVHRAGTRLFTRGIDSTGNVSNYVETEQLIEFNGHRTSFVQTRGSIPLFWYQAPNLKYKPKPQLSVHEDHQTACARHFEAQIFHYGKQILINLVRFRVGSKIQRPSVLLFYYSSFSFVDRSTRPGSCIRKSVPQRGTAH